MIVMKDKNNNMVPCSFEEAQKKASQGWSVHINKSGKKITAKAEAKEVKKEVKKTKKK